MHLSKRVMHNRDPAGIKCSARASTNHEDMPALIFEPSYACIATRYGAGPNWLGKPTKIAVAGLHGVASAGNTSMGVATHSTDCSLPSKSLIET